MKNTIVLCVIMVIVIGGCGAATQTPLSTSTYSDDYDLLIMAIASFVEELLPLVEHKVSHGIRTKIVSLDDIYSGTYFQVEGRDNAEKIKYFIKNAIEQWGITYVMLVGGKEEMPVRCIYPDSSSGGPSKFITDLYYADVYDETGAFCSWDSNGNNRFGEMNDNEIVDDVDLYPDVCIGRMLCGTESEVQTVVNKIIEYESKDVRSTSWFNNLVLCGGDEYPYIIVEMLYPLLLKRTGRIAFEGEYISEQIALLLNNFNAKKIFASATRDNEAFMFTIENIHNAINEGAGFLLFSTHGDTDKVLTHPPFRGDVWLPSFSGYSSSDVKNLTNEEMLPVAIFCACLCGDFDAVKSPIAWEFIKHGSGGSIASLACTTVSDALPGTLCTESLIGYLTKGFFQEYSEGNEILGEVWKATICNYLNDDEAFRIGAPDLTFGRLTLIQTPCFLNHFVIEEWTLFGDPSLKIGGYPGI